MYTHSYTSRFLLFSLLRSFSLTAQTSEPQHTSVHLWTVQHVNSNMSLSAQLLQIPALFTHLT